MGDVEGAVFSLKHTGVRVLILLVFIQSAEVEACLSTFFKEAKN